MANKLVVISFDAMIFEDLEILDKLPNFARVLQQGSRVNRMKCIYPTLTYPCHVTMLTGTYPSKHGVTRNTRADTVKSPEWLFEHRYVRVKDLPDACREAGLTTAAVGWPVTGCHPSVDYLVNECWPADGAPIEEYAAKYLEQGTSKQLMDEVVRPLLPMRYGRQQPRASYFLAHVSAEIIKKYAPDFLALHIGLVDGMRHKTGVFSPEVKASLSDIDAMLGIVLDGICEAGLTDLTNVVVTADHGQLNCSRIINLNRIFADEGLITVDEHGAVKDWQAFAFSVGMSAQVHLKNCSPSLFSHVRSLLESKVREGVWGIERVLTREECLAEGLDGEFALVVEGDSYTKLGNAWTGDICVPLPLRTAGPVRGDHGFHPDKGPRPPFLACGPDILQGVTVEDAHLVDGAPTYAALLGVSLPDADGQPLTALLK